MKVSNETKLRHKQTLSSLTSGAREHFVSDIVKSNNLKLGAEIGVRTGRTLFHVLDNNPTTSMYAIDKSIVQFYNDDVKSRYGNRIKAFEVDSRVSPDYVPDGSLDFYFIDASHTYKNVVADILAWSLKIKSNGWMIGHDIDYPSVEKAVLNTIGFYEVGPDNVWVARQDKTYTGLIKL